ncbi:hypothetical protein PHYPSEUDO_010345 [Phytophthora pseudosyringae]|uniref:RxLR effector protein n=1 Tax=Phytophthora pseudosyringae TaxID=221518 RepID=A0A8T1WBB9_9STRA|nr:hypothetical protein PHYPSEUDO_010345 [Phytophthora pseudosyringae]
MGLRCLVFVVVFFTLAACCNCVTVADSNVMAKDLEADSTRLIDVNGKRNLRAHETNANDEERAFPGVTSLKTLLQKIPHVGHLKTMVKENPALAKANVFVSKRPKLHAASLIVKGQLKPLAIIGAVALTGGYIMYLVKG